VADQEFLASYGVKIDEPGISRLQSILKSNRDLANEVAKAFGDAAKAVDEYAKKAQGSQDGSSDNGGNNRSASGAGNQYPGSPQSVKELVKLQLSGILTNGDWPTMPRNTREFALSNLETMYLGMASKDSANASKQLLSWQDAGLSSDPSKIPGFKELQSAASEVLRDPIAKAREYMQQALDANAEDEDITEYLQKIEETLREPFEQVRKMFDDFDFGDTPGESSNEEGFLSQLTHSREELSGLREEASKPIILKLDTSPAISSARSAFQSIKNIFSNPIPVTISVQLQGSGSNGGDTGNGAGSQTGPTRMPMSTGGRFSSPTDVQVAEDGSTEYIIPVKKEDRALPLLRQLLGELTPAAREQLTNSQFTSHHSQLDLPGAGQSGMGSITQNNSNVSAPVNIHVQASGANAESIGESIYNTAEKYLLRTLKGAMA